jgi:4,5-DOPA dioxygenase extradiol
MTTSPAEVVALRDHANYRDAVPTPDHFIPLVYLAGLAGAAGSNADVLVEGYTYGSLSMTAYTVGAHCPEGTATRAAELPSPDIVPVDGANV